MSARSKKTMKVSKRENRKKKARKEMVAKVKSKSKTSRQSGQNTPPDWAKQVQYVPRYRWDSSL